MRLKNLELQGFKSFAQKTVLEFKNPIVCIVGPNGSGKSNVVESFRFVLGEQSIKSMRGKLGADLIFKGSKTLAKASRAHVTVYFNNEDKVFKLSNDEGENVNLNYETVSVSREVFTDGTNNYILNGTDVRLKDINNLLSSVNIGSSGHHIISQGEADRILNASLKDLREMIEDALGLKIYQYKMREAAKKLERSEENMKEVGLLRRENAPHLNFLKRQMEKFEKAKEMRSELADLYLAYFYHESLYLNKEHKALADEKEKISRELKEISEKISTAEGGEEGARNERVRELGESDKKIAERRALQGELERKLGRIEGMIEAKESKQKLTGRCPMCGSELKELDKNVEERKLHDENEIAELKSSREETIAKMAEILEEVKGLTLASEKLKQSINTEMETLRDREREKFTLKVRHQELASNLQVIRIKEENLAREESAFQNEKREGAALAGDRILQYENYKSSGEMDRAHQEEERKKLERIKIKLEDFGAGSSDEISKEYQEVAQRDSFLAKETEDLEKSIESLNQLIADLKEKIDKEFKEGVKKINKEFQEFFSLLFNGGNASLSVVVEEKRKKKIEDLDEEIEDPELAEGEPEEGVEINVSLPHKKVKELHALSGGERSLTSIALLFAMSQVNPPPFLILDETDAALDEANSKKFGDMIERLSKHSQLIVVTHNRETMSRAGMLYGVTVGSDGASKLLSVKFDEAVAVAK